MRFKSDVKSSEVQAVWRKMWGISIHHLPDGYQRVTREEEDGEGGVFFNGSVQQSSGPAMTWMAWEVSVKSDKWWWCGVIFPGRMGG